MEGEKSEAEHAQRRAVAHATAREADRRVAGVAAAARVVRSLGEARAGEIWLTIADEKPLAPRTLADIERRRGGSEVWIVRHGAAPADLAPEPAPPLSAAEI